MQQKIRIKLLFTFVVIIVAVFGLRLFQVQILNADVYIKKAQDQYIERNYHLYDRGDIFFQDKDGELISGATVGSGYFIIVYPKEVEDVGSLYKGLSSVIELDKKDLYKKIRETDKKNIKIASQISDEEMRKIKDLDLQGISFHPVNWRFYPGGEVAAHVLGLVGYQGDEKAGRYGLERQYEDFLKRPENDYKIDFFARVFGDVGDGLSSNDQSDRGDVVTTIEPMVQHLLEKEIQKTKKEWSSSSIGGIIIDPSTGAVKAMALRPAFDPNNTSSASSSDIFSNDLVENVYEMGSVVKPLTIAAGLDAGVIEPDSVFYDSGSVEFDGFTISNYDGKGNGEINMQEVLNKSVNTGVVHVMEKIGTKAFAEYMRNFGLNSKTGIDLPSESDNLLRNFGSSRTIEYATAAFGQGVAVTPIGMARALSSLANGGKIVQPYIVERIEKSDGETIEVSKTDQKKERVISEEASREISRMLTNTVDEALLNGDVALPGYSVAAKTGTAQMAYLDRRGYSEDAFLHSFFGYFPSYDPEFLIFLYHIEPKDARYASQTLTEPFMDIVKFLIQYYDISPDR